MLLVVIFAVLGLEFFGLVGVVVESAKLLLLLFLALFALIFLLTILTGKKIY